MYPQESGSGGKFEVFLAESHRAAALLVEKTGGSVTCEKRGHIFPSHHNYTVLGAGGVGLQVFEVVWRVLTTHPANAAGQVFNSMGSGFWWMISMVSIARWVTA